MNINARHKSFAGPFLKNSIDTERHLPAPWVIIRSAKIYHSKIIDRENRSQTISKAIYVCIGPLKS